MHFILSQAANDVFCFNSKTFVWIWWHFSLFSCSLKIHPPAWCQSGLHGLHVVFPVGQAHVPGNVMRNSSLMTVQCVLCPPKRLKTVWLMRTAVSFGLVNFKRMFCMFLFLTLPCVLFLTLASSSCLVTEWGEWDACSATCGLGMKRRERLVKMPPADGSVCGTEVLQVEKCMMPECRE